MKAGKPTVLIGNWKPTKTQAATIQRAAVETMKYLREGKGGIRCDDDVWGAILDAFPRNGTTLLALMEARVREILAAWGGQEGSLAHAFTPNAPDWWDGEVNVTVGPGEDRPVVDVRRRVSS